MNHRKSPAHTHRHKRLMVELVVASAYDSASKTLHSRMKKCGGPDWGQRFTCRSPACPGCRDRYIAKQRREVLAKFRDAPCSEMAMVTVVAAVVLDVSLIEAAVSKLRKDIRNMIDRRRKSSSAWDAFELVAWLETDCFLIEEFQHLGPDKRAQIEQFMIPLYDQSGVAWVVTVHGIARSGPLLSVGDLRGAFHDQWPGYRQSHVQPFSVTKPLTRSLGDIVNYALKHECTTEFYDPANCRVIAREWSSASIRDYYTFVYKWSRGFQSTKFTVRFKNPNKLKQENESDDPLVDDIITMGFIHSFSVLPVDYYYWKP